MVIVLDMGEKMVTEKSKSRNMKFVWIFLYENKNFHEKERVIDLLE